MTRGTASLDTVRVTRRWQVDAGRVTLAQRRKRGGAGGVRKANTSVVAPRATVRLVVRP